MLSSRHFGPVEHQRDAVFEFPTGLPGFEQERRFVPIEHASSKPIVFLQSPTTPELCFVTLPVRVVQPDYGLAEERQPEIGAEVLCLAIVSVAEGKLPTVNLLAPIVVNLGKRRGVQAIQEDSACSHQHPLLAAEREEACS
jgi:flagellar assembly factor FliW